MTAAPHLRCAVYTRKSSEEGLEQAFNSLAAQHEACAAYIASQRHEGWRLMPERFDDGGVSGGTLERPALVRLLSEIDAGRVGMVVVYKIDRLTRSLTDFARLVERLDRAGCSFVSVTQAFNTSSSMGRLTLNVLLSFAQFEREVTAERIRDKIAASKQKGMWMGGTLPLGYDSHPDPQRRELVVNAAEAETVSTLFRLYAAHGNLRTVETDAARLSLVSKRRLSRSGNRTGGRPFTRGQLHHLLTNPVYLGRIRHKNRTYEGRHTAIVETALWEEVQEIMRAASGRARGKDPNGDSGSRALLTGRFTDETGDRLTPTHTVKAGRRYRYYVSHRLITGGADPTGWRLPGPAFEAAIRMAVSDHLRRCATRREIEAEPDPSRLGSLAERLIALAQDLDRMPARINALVTRGRLSPGTVEIDLDATVLGAHLDLSPGRMSSTLLRLTAELSLARRGAGPRLVIGDTTTSAPDPALQRALAQAHHWSAALKAGASLRTLAAEAGHAEGYLRRRIRLAFLAPAIQEAILDGTQPPGLTLERLVRGDIALDWAEQARQFRCATA